MAPGVAQQLNLHANPYFYQPLPERWSAYFRRIHLPANRTPGAATWGTRRSGRSRALLTLLVAGEALAGIQPGATQAGDGRPKRPPSYIPAPSQNQHAPARPADVFRQYRAGEEAA